MTSLYVNGVQRETKSGTHTLLEALRNDFGLTGTKLACGEGECGACTVLVDGRPICACLQLASSVEGRDVRTAEYLNETELGHQVVDALVNAGAVQCGFCTPGILVSAVAHLRSDTPKRLEAALEGNLCRCTGYIKIREALASVREQPDRLGEATGPRDSSLSQALAQLAKQPDLVPISGGTDLLVKYEHDLDRMRFLDLTKLDDPGLRSISHSEGELKIGALVTWNDLLRSEVIVREMPLLAATSREIASEQIRNMGTIGGNIVTASPAGDGLVALNALGAEVVIRHQDYQRTVPLEEFVTGPGKTSLRPGELITMIRIALPSRGSDMRQFFRKVGPRKAQSISKVSLGLISKSERGTISELRFCFGAVGPKPMLCPETTRFLVGREATRETLERARELLMTEISPIDDHRSTAAYRREVAARLLAQALAHAV